MLTTTAAFKNFKREVNLNHRLILKIERSGGDIYFSDIDFRVDDNSTEVMVHGGIIDWGSISSKVNLSTKKYSVGNVTIKFNNGMMFHTGTVETPISYELQESNYINQTASIIVWYEGMTDIDTDGLVIFKGICQPIKTGDVDFTMQLVDSSMSIHTNICTDTINKTDFPSAPPVSIGRYIPIVYGNYETDLEQRGALVEALWIEPEKLIIMGDTGCSISRVFLDDKNLGFLTEILPAEYSTNSSDGGNTTLTFVDSTVQCYAYLYPNRNITMSATVTGFTEGANETGYNAIDQDASTDIDCDVGTGQIDYYFPDNLDSGSVVGSYPYYIQVRGDASESGGTAELRMIDTSSTTELDAIDLESFWADPPINSYESSNVTTGGYTYDWASLSDYNLDIKVNLTSGSGVRVEFMQIRLRVLYSIAIDTSWKIYVGLTYGYNIQHPANIIKDILETLLSVAAGDIDATSFSDAVTALSGWEHDFQLTEPINSLSVIQKICQQSPLIYTIDANGKSKIAVLESSYSTSDRDDYLYDNDIKRGSFKIYKTSINELVNDVIINYRYANLESKYLKLATDADATSKTTYNITKQKIIDADYVRDSVTAAALATHIADSTGFYNTMRTLIEFETISYENIDWEIGDIIQIDTSVDDILRDGQNSWAYQLFMIIGKKIKSDTITFTMVYLDTDTPP